MLWCIRTGLRHEALLGQALCGLDVRTTAMSAHHTWRCSVTERWVPGCCWLHGCGQLAFKISPAGKILQLAGHMPGVSYQLNVRRCLPVAVVITLCSLLLGLIDAETSVTLTFAVAALPGHVVNI